MTYVGDLFGRSAKLSRAASCPHVVHFLRLSSCCQTPEVCLRCRRNRPVALSCCESHVLEAWLRNYEKRTEGLRERVRLVVSLEDLGLNDSARSDVMSWDAFEAETKNLRCKGNTEVSPNAELTTTSSWAEHFGRWQLTITQHDQSDVSSSKDTSM